MKIADFILLLPYITNGWTLAALVAVLIFFYAARKKE
jgi:hypothetical protein